MKDDKIKQQISAVTCIVGNDTRNNTIISPIPTCLLQFSQKQKLHMLFGRNYDTLRGAMSRSSKTDLDGHDGLERPAKRPRTMIPTHSSNIIVAYSQRTDIIVEARKKLSGAIVDRARGFPYSRWAEWHFTLLGRLSPFWFRLWTSSDFPQRSTCVRFEEKKADALTVLGD